MNWRIAANQLSEVCSIMLNEPLINPIVGPVFSWKSLNIAEDARIDVSGKRFWICSQMAFSDIKVFYPLTTTTATQKA